MSAMRLVTAEEVASNAIERWRSQYAHWTPKNKFADGTTKGEKDAALDAADPTPENIERILNTGWAYPTCDCCNEFRTVVVQFDGDWLDRNISVCLSCAERVKQALAGFANAKAKVTYK